MNPFDGTYQYQVNSPNTSNHSVSDSTNITSDPNLSMSHIIGASTLKSPKLYFNTAVANSEAPDLGVGNLSTNLQGNITSGSFVSTHSTISNASPNSLLSSVPHIINPGASNSVPGPVVLRTNGPSRNNNFVNTTANTNYLYDTGYSSSAGSGYGSGLSGYGGPHNNGSPGGLSATTSTSTSSTVVIPNLSYNTATAGSNSHNYGGISHNIPELPPIVPGDWDFPNWDRTTNGISRSLTSGPIIPNSRPEIPHSIIGFPNSVPIPNFEPKKRRRHTATVSNMTPETAARNRCPICQKQFKRPSSLQVHIVSHTGEKMFQCPWPECHKFFSVKSNMTRHYKLHLRDKGYTG